jgi:hypothetical protein
METYEIFLECHVDPVWRTGETSQFESNETPHFVQGDSRFSFSDVSND